MTRVGIVADDLTGAADTASQFVRAGWHTELQLRPGASAAQVLAVTTDSRGLSAVDAAGAVTTAVQELSQAGVTHLYKKVDSTVRGQVRAEVRAALNSWSPGAIAVVCPAFPAMGRTLVDGELCVNGVPVSQTALRTDPITPVTESHLPTLLGASHVPQTAGESAGTLAGRIRAGGAIVVVDAAGEDDVQRLAEAVMLLGPGAVPVGSAGLARHLARLWPAEKDVARAMRSISAAEGTITLVIVTSLQDLARRQAAAVAAAGAHHAQPTPADLIDDDAWAAWSAKVLRELERLGSTLLLTAPIDRRRYLPAALIPDRFADLASRIIDMGRQGTGAAGVSGVVVTGGDGARALARALHATGIEICGEVITGVPMGTLIGGVAEGLPIVTKAGAFGDPDTLVKAVELLAQLKLDPAVRNGSYT